MSVRTTTLAFLAGIGIAALALSACGDPRVAVTDPPPAAAASPPTLDLAYGPAARQRLDVLLPSGPSNGQAVVYLHGGGWSGGDKSDPLPRLFRDLLADGYTIVSADYRYASEAPWPAQVTDAKAAVRWARANLGRWGVDARRIVLGGWSAGAHIAIVAAASAGWWEPGPGRTVVDGVVAYQPALDVGALAAIVAERGAGDPAWGLFGGRPPTLDSIRALDAAIWASADDPPVHLIAGEVDPIAPAAAMRRFVAAADAAHDGSGRGARLDVVAGGVHGTELEPDRAALAEHLEDAFRARNRRPVQSPPWHHGR